MKKYILLASIFVLISITLMIYYVTNHSSQIVEEKSSSSKNHSEIVDKQKNKGFIENQIIVDLNKDSTISTAEKIANRINAVILPESIPEFQSYVFEFSSKTFETEKEILDYCDNLKNTYSEIELCSPNHVMFPDSE